LKTCGFFHLIIINYWLQLSKKLKLYKIDKILPVYNLGNSDINIEGITSSDTKQFLAMLRVFKTEITHTGVAFA